MSFPSSARDYAQQGVSLDHILIEHPHATFFMYAETTAMVGAHMPPGSLLIIDRAVNAQNGDIILAVLNGEFIVRYLRKNGHTCWLYPANRQYREMKITQEMNMTVWGVVVQIIINPKYVAQV